VATVDVLHGQGVAQREGDGLVLAAVGQPVPGEHALAADDEVLTAGLDRLQEGGGLGGQVLLEDRAAGVVKDVGVHAPGVEIDAAVKSVRPVVVAQHDGLVR
jgi:hypothetical protein